MSDRIEPLKKYEVEKLVWECPSTNSTETLVLLAFSSFTDGEGKCFPGIPTLSKMTKLHESSVQRIINALVAKEVIAKESRTKPDGSQTSNLYTINFKKLVDLTTPPHCATTPPHCATTPPHCATTPPHCATTPPALCDHPPRTVRPDLIQSTDPIKPIQSTRTDPDRAHENFEDAEILEPDPEPIPTPPVKPTPKPNPPDKQSISSEGGSSAACRTTETNSITNTNTLAQFEKRFSPTLSRQELAEITQALIDTYNKTKPSCWGTCTQITAFLTNQVSKLLDAYLADLEIPQAIESLKNDVAAAHLSCKGDDFYDKPSFGIPSIAFFLEPNRIDKLRNRAQVWYDRPQQQKEQLARVMVRDAIEGIPCWESGTILTGLRLSLAKTRYRDWYEANDPQCPPIEYLQQYFPQILEAT